MLSHLPYVDIPQPDGMPPASLLRITTGPRGTGLGEGAISLLNRFNGSSCQVAATIESLDMLIESLTEFRATLVREQAAASN